MTARAATVVPQNVEKLPLFHWRPGTRLLSVGSRDGAHFHGADDADANTFQRSVMAPQLIEAMAKLGTAGIAATWARVLGDPAAVELLVEIRRLAPASALVVATPGVGDVNLLNRLLPVVDAWILLSPRQPGPLAHAILESAAHVEVQVGLSGGLDEGAGNGAIPDLPWARAHAVHLFAERPAEADALEDWIADARPRFPAGTALYDHHHPHTDCPCGERLVWRAGGRSRLDAHDPATGTCRVCGRRSLILT